MTSNLEQNSNDTKNERGDLIDCSLPPEDDNRKH